MSKKLLIVAILGIACMMAIYAGGKKDNESYEADNPEGFTTSIPIGHRKPGKYNFYIEAKDKAENSYVAGAHNIWIDPVSDLPQTTIINPRPNMHVKGNLNIVGSAIDDDGIDFVEFVVTRGADGRGEEVYRNRADGKEFWSFYLETTDKEIWTDGVYTITAWSTDINGLSGISEDFKAADRKFHQVSWNLDRKKPEAKLTNHEIGALVAGKIKLQGTVFDGNGIKGLGFSIDEGETYVPVKFKANKGDTINFEILLDTRNFEDGPRIFWFKSFDGMGTMGLTAHLLFINNTKPEVEILYPEEDVSVGGVFSTAVFAKHPVGLTSVTWRLDKQAGEFPMVIGNHWWIEDFDIRDHKGKTIELEIRAEDLSGNVTVVRRRYKVDQVEFQPKVVIETPTAGMTLAGDVLNVKGLATDNTAVASILYSLNNGVPMERPCNGFFQFAIPGLVGGSYTLEVWAKNIYGIEGPRTQVKGIVAPGALPEPRISVLRTKIGRKVSNTPFFTGITVNPEDEATLELAIPSVVPITSASVSFEGRQPASVLLKGGKDHVYRGDIVVPSGMTPGFIKFDLQATDSYGRTARWEDYVYNVGDFIPSNYFWVRSNRSEDGRLIMAPGELQYVLASFKTMDVSLEGNGSEYFTVDLDEHGRVSLVANREGNFGPMTLHMSNESETTINPSFSVLVDTSTSAIVVQPPGWVQSTVALNFTINKPTRLQAVEYSLDLGSTWFSLLPAYELTSPILGKSFTQTLSLGIFQDGAIDIHVRAVDESGNISTSIVTAQKDTKPPEVKLIAPIPEARVNGAINIALEVKDEGSLRRVLYQRPGRGDTPAISEELTPSRFMCVLTDPFDMPLVENMSIVFEDQSGNRTVFNDWHFIIDNEMDIPITEIVLPFEDEIVIDDFVLTGVAFDDDAIGTVSWQIDDGPFQTMEASFGYAIPIPLSSLKDNEHSITVFVTDIYGVPSEKVTRNIRVSLSEPVAVVTTPSFDMINAGYIEMSGGSTDENGIEKVEVSLDNGNSFSETRLNAYDNTAEWFFEFDSQILKDGPHVAFIRVTDKYEVEAIYAGLLNIDNTPPEISLESPVNGEVTTGPLNILGQASDINMEAKSVRIRSLEGATVPARFNRYIPGQNIFIQEFMDLDALTEGKYNVEIEVEDKAGNTTIISRNFELNKEAQRNAVHVLYPLNGDHIQGSFNIYGNTSGIDTPRTATLRVNNFDVATNDVAWTGFYRFTLSEEYLQPGWNNIEVSCTFGGDPVIETAEIKDDAGNVTGTMTRIVGWRNGGSARSEVRRIFYQSNGPWVTIDNLTMGDFAYDRPWLIGRAGYTRSLEEEALLQDKETDKELMIELKEQVLDYVEISFDNGSTFERTKRSFDKGSDWKYHLETGELKEGFHYMVIRANMKNGDIAVTRTLVQVDKTAPYIKLIAPEPGGRYNTDLQYSALASDDVAMASLTYHLRVGDKFFYEVPGFLQGLYLEATIPPFIRQIAPEAPVIFAGGATYFDAGFGLSFFDDNVKIQAQYGFITQELYEALGGEKQQIGESKTVRYGGHVLGLKILANVYNQPFAPLIGPDFEWLSASFSLGANFSLFDLAQEGYTQSGDPTWMSALLLQVEFPKVTIPKQKRFRKFSLFTEGQLWFVPTDVNAKDYGMNVVIPHVIMGLRMYVF